MIALRALIAAILAIFGPAWGAGDVELAPAVRVRHPNAVAMPVSDLPGWRLTFNESFSQDVPVGSFVQRMNRWAEYQDGWLDGGDHHGTYAPSRVLSVHDGICDFYLHTENGEHLVATIYPKALASVLYGRFSIRWRADPMLGYMVIPTIVWPNGNRAADGEIDHPEFTLARRGTPSFIHYVDAQPTLWAYGAYLLDSTVWHTSTVEWLPGLVILYVDGREVLRSAPGAGINHTPSRVAIQVTTAVHADAPTDDVAGNVQVDWVAAWAPA